MMSHTSFFAHSLEQENESEWHPLKDHLTATGDLAAAFAAVFGASHAARVAGLLHDLGKYCDAFQARLHGSKERVDHAAAGAQEITGRTYGSPYDAIMVRLIAYAIAGHHAGLADFQDHKKRLEKMAHPLNPCWREEVRLAETPLWPNLKVLATEKDEIAFQMAFLGRMIFSCLVDADRKDTERFYVQHHQTTADRNWPDLQRDLPDLIARFDAYMDTRNNRDTAVNVLRHDIFAHVRSQAGLPTGLFTLTVPTGGGKTLTSLGFALDHARVHQLRRIIYAIPFTSIIDQTASIFRHVLGGDMILEHHSSVEEKNDSASEQRDKLRLAMEDWAAPVVVTTNVQFFESLFSNRPSLCRKLHNIANSVIILDEAQTLPLTLLRPCLRALEELTRNYNTTIILCTATQPALDKTDFKQGGLALQGRELAPNPALLAQQLARARITQGGDMGDEAIIAALQETLQALVIVNTRRHALELYRRAKQAELTGLVHLTTRQHATHRREILAEVRKTLTTPKPCRLIATSLVEAGVDLDFPRVWRAEAGLDSIAQAAGRCNREGRRPVDESIVTVFRAKDYPAPRSIQQLVPAYRSVASAHTDLLAPDAIRAYFREVFWLKGAEQLDHEKILECFRADGTGLYYDYETAARNFRMIEEGSVPVIICENEKVEKILGKLNNPAASVGAVARELQPYLVQLPLRDRQKLLDGTNVEHYRSDLWGDQFWVVTKQAKIYTKETGLIWEQADELGQFLF